MNFFKNDPATQSAAKVAAAARLSTIVGRGQAELESYSAYPDPPQASGVQRRFWTPDELDDGQGSD